MLANIALRWLDVRPSLRPDLRWRIGYSVSDNGGQTTEDRNATFNPSSVVRRFSSGQ
jgi:hypothetical protein